MISPSQPISFLSYFPVIGLTISSGLSTKFRTNTRQHWSSKWWPNWRSHNHWCWWYSKRGTRGIISTATGNKCKVMNKERWTPCILTMCLFGWPFSHKSRSLLVCPTNLHFTISFLTWTPLFSNNIMWKKHLQASPGFKAYHPILCMHWGVFGLLVQLTPATQFNFLTQFASPG